MAKRRIPTLIAVITLLVVWEAWVRLGHVPSTMIAAPSELAQATVETWPTLWPATEVTLLEGTVGFLFAVTCGILIGILLYCSRIADAALFPLLSAAQTMPLISIAPLFLIWFGFEVSGKIVIVAVFGLFPIAVQLGIDPIHLGIIMVVNMEIGMVTPPVGLNLFVTSGVTGMNLVQVTRAALPWLSVLLVFLVMVTYIPQISLFLPDLLMGK